MPAEGSLLAGLDAGLPAQLEVGRGNAISLCGWCFHSRRRLCGVELRVAGEARPAEAWGMRRPDVRDSHPAESARLALRSGFWGMVPLTARAQDGAAKLSLAAKFDDGATEVVNLGEVQLLAGGWAANGRQLQCESVVDAGRVAVCMATHEPPIDLFASQVESLREQTHGDWTCVVADDGSAPARLKEMRAVLGEDERFALHPFDSRVGPYRNFERVLGLSPPEARLIALCDQDDRWRPEKLEALVAGLGEADLVYSDQRIVSPSGEVVSDSYWTRRRNGFTDLTSLLVANTVTGAASLFRRELLDFALPFPPAPGGPYHDHWLALVALAGRGIAYIDRPLYDYVQHRGAQLGHARANRAISRSDRRTEAGATGPGPPLRRRPFYPGWRGAYFRDYRRLCHLALVLNMRCGAGMTPTQRRALRPFLRPERPLLDIPRFFARGAIRPLLGCTETLGAERGLAGGLVWRLLANLLRSAAPPG